MLRRAVATAQIARTISLAQGARGDRPEQAYAAGLLHDVGLLVLAARQPDQFAQVLARVRENKIPICTAEQEVYGATHPEIGACLLELWGLPPRITEGVTYHHRPIVIDSPELTTVTATHVASAIWAECEPLGEIRAAEEPYVPQLDGGHLSQAGFAAELDRWRDAAQRELTPKDTVTPGH